MNSPYRNQDPLVVKAEEAVEKAQRELQDALCRVFTSSLAETFIAFGTGSYSDRELEEHLQIFCHRARVHHRSKYVLQRAYLLSPPPLIPVSEIVYEHALDRDFHRGIDRIPPAEETKPLTVADIQAAVEILQKNDATTYCMVCKSGYYIHIQGKPTKLSQFVCTECGGKSDQGIPQCRGEAPASTPRADAPCVWCAYAGDLCPKHPRTGNETGG